MSRVQKQALGVLAIGIMIGLAVGFGIGRM